MGPCLRIPVFLMLQGALEILASFQDTAEYRASACYGTHKNFIQIDCTPLRVEIVAVRNGAKRLNSSCPPHTFENNYREDCCNYKEGDCVVPSIGAFPTECMGVSFCNPRAIWADTSKACNTNVFPSQTHYTEIIFKCIKVQDPAKDTTTTSSTTTTTITTSPTTSPTSVIITTNTTVNYTSVIEGRTLAQPDNGTTVPLRTTRPQTGHVSVVETSQPDSDSFTPAMIGGMIAGIVGLMLTIFIFMFYWGRKRQIRTISPTKQPQTVWDFLLANSMSVRTFRGYDNFSSAGTSASLSSEESGSPVIRKTVWLPNISVDNGQGEPSVVTSDDNISVVTVERANPPVSPTESNIIINRL